MLLTLVTAGLLLINDVKQPPTAPPTSLVLIECKGHIEPWLTKDEAENAAFTHSENFKWDYPNGKMLCKREQVEMYDPDEGKPQGLAGTVFALHPNFSDFTQCTRVGATLEQQWDDQHRSGDYRVWRVGCPSPIVNETVDADGAKHDVIIGYKLPDCGHFDTIVCAVDTDI